MKIRFEAIPQIGLAMALDGQRFDLIDIIDHTRLDGEATKLLVWQSECSDCGDGFTAKSPHHSIPGNRRCDIHKQPGKPVKHREL